MWPSLQKGHTSRRWPVHTYGKNALDGALNPGDNLPWPEPLHDQLQQCEQEPEGAGKALHPLYAQFVAFNTLLKQAKPPGLAIPQQRRHLALYYAQVSQHLRFECTHHVHTARTQILFHCVAALINMALEKRE